MERGANRTPPLRKSIIAKRATAERCIHESDEKERTLLAVILEPCGDYGCSQRVFKCNGIMSVQREEKCFEKCNKSGPTVASSSEPEQDDIPLYTRSDKLETRAEKEGEKPKKAGFVIPRKKKQSGGKLESLVYPHCSNTCSVHTCKRSTLIDSFFYVVNCDLTSVYSLDSLF